MLLIFDHHACLLLRYEPAAIIWMFLGVLCFDYCYRNNILITGGLDHNVRIWNPYMPKRAIAVLMGHLDAVTHVQMYRY